jgi:hypothetical protein
MPHVMYIEFVHEFKLLKKYPFIMVVYRDIRDVAPTLARNEFFIKMINKFTGEISTSVPREKFKLVDNVNAIKQINTYCEKYHKGPVSTVEMTVADIPINMAQRILKPRHGTDIYFKVSMGFNVTLKGYMFDIGIQRMTNSNEIKRGLLRKGVTMLLDSKNSRFRWFSFKSRSGFTYEYYIQNSLMMTYMKIATRKEIIVCKNPKRNMDLITRLKYILG